MEWPYVSNISGLGVDGAIFIGLEGFLHFNFHGLGVVGCGLVGCF